MVHSPPHVRSTSIAMPFDFDVAEITLEPPCRSARVVVRVLKMLGILSRPFRFRGFWHGARALGQLVDRNQACVVRLGSGSRFHFRLSDPYWSRIVSRVYSYEPEIGFILKRMRGKPFVFLDCGANFGYWSVLCSSPEIGCHSVVAVEALATTFRELERNSELNSARFEARLNAIHSVDGRTVFVSERNGDHAGASVVGDEKAGVAVQTITIDSLLSDRAVPPSVPVIVKLDVEGVEIEAMKGASALLQREALIIYEDHGQDPTSAVTDFIVCELGLSVFFIDDALNVRRIPSAAAAGAVKLKRKKGYNFFAVTPGSTFDRELSVLARA